MLHYTVTRLLFIRRSLLTVAHFYTLCLFLHARCTAVSSLIARRLKLGVAYTSIRMGVVSTSTDREKINRENYNWLYFRQYRENLDLRKFPAIRYLLFQ